MDWDRTRRFDDHRGGESYRPGSSRGYSRRSRSPPRIRSPPSRFVADTWVPSTGRTYSRPRSRSPPLFRRRSRSPQPYTRDSVASPYSATYNPRRFSPRRDGRLRSPIPSTRRPRSPYAEDRSRENTWNRSTTTARQPRDSSTSGRDHGYHRKERRPPSTSRQTRSNSTSRHGISHEDDVRFKDTARARSPLYSGRRDTTADRYPGQRRRSPSPSDTFSRRPSGPGSISNSRRSSPIENKINTSSRSNRSRSPLSSLPSNRRRSRARGSIPYDDGPTPAPRSRMNTPEARLSTPDLEQSSGRSLPGQEDTDPPRPPEIHGRTNYAGSSYPNHAPSQPRAFSSASNLCSPQSVPPHGPRTIPSHPRASNISLLSAPTRPRGAPNFKDSGWVGAASRRGPASVGSHGAPTAPRSTHLSSSVGEPQRLRSSRHTSVSGSSSSPAPRYSKYLVGLNTIVPGGRLTLSDSDVFLQKRLLQLEADKDRLLECITDSEKMKRIGLRDWDKFDRESSVCALKSELAEGHLQCITDSESTIDRTIF